MPQASIRHYLDQLPIRQAEMRSMLIEASTLPYQKEGQRRSVFSALRRQLEAGLPPQRAHPAQLALIGIGVELVSVSQAESPDKKEQA